ncbi:MAG TPA: methyltransferase domain-containing protein [Kiritimatiellia bacterium]|nr:methyltransferase domain-containing protein [Kiritimatiellia bacterium]
MINQLKKQIKKIEWLKPLYSKNARLLLKLKWMGVGKDVDTVEGAESDGLRQRRYESYSAYLEHQKSKLTMLKSGDVHGVDKMDLESYDRSYREDLRARLQGSPELRPGIGVLCLAARIGTEVKAFLDLGCFSVGIDLNPGPDNSYVLPGDFHHLVFSDASVGAVFCNSLDHAYDLGTLMSEIRRVLVPAGVFIAEIPLGSEEAKKANMGFWEATDWASVNDVIKVIKSHGFEVRRTVDDPSGKERKTLIFQKGA